MATGYIDVMVYVLVDEGGNVVASHDESLLGDLYDEHVNEAAGVGRRVVKLTLSMPLPEAVEISLSVPGEPAPTAAVVE